MLSFGANCTPVFGFLVTSSLGFKARDGSALFAFAEVNNVHSLRSTSGAKPANLLMACMAVGCFPT